MNTYQSGNAIRLTAEFKDWDGLLVDPDSIRLIIYDGSYQKIDEREIGLSHQLSKGVYQYDYIFENVGYFVYEWYAIIQGTPSLIRQNIKISTM